MSTIVNKQIKFIELAKNINDLPFLYNAMNDININEAKHAFLSGLQTR